MEYYCHKQETESYGGVTRSSSAYRNGKRFQESVKYVKLNWNLLLSVKDLWGKSFLVVVAIVAFWPSFWSLWISSELPLHDDVLALPTLIKRPPGGLRS